MRTLRKIGRYAICENRGALHLRWTPPKQKRRSERLEADLSRGYDRVLLTLNPPDRKSLTPDQRHQLDQLSEDLNNAEIVARSLIRRVIDPAELVDPASDGNPTFGEIWLSFEQNRDKHLKSDGRKSLLKKRCDIYYKPYLWTTRMTGLSAAVGRMVNSLEKNGRADRRKGVAKTIKLHPNTIYDISSTAIAAGNHAVTVGLSVIPIPSIQVANTTAPKDRKSRGRYLTLDEIALLIDAAASSRHRHLLHLLLLDLSCAVRIGAMGDAGIENIKRDLDVINLLDVFEVESNKRRPIVPITGPVGWVLEECIATSGKDGRLIHYRGEGIAAKNWTQIMNRIKDHAIPMAKERGWSEEQIAKLSDRVNWMAIRRTLIDWLRNHIPASAISAVAGHVELTQQDRARIFEEGSPTTEIYKRRALKPTYQVGDALERKWWPELQKRIQSDIRLDVDAGRMRNILDRIEKEGEYEF